LVDGFLPQTIWGGLALVGVLGVLIGYAVIFGG
jgi:xanthosine utilization system XapX-like protein